MSKEKKAAPIEGQCHATGCKGKETRFSFCDEHFDQYKFGLINKLGDRVPDYDKKFEHYSAYVERKRAGKVA